MNALPRYAAILSDAEDREFMQQAFDATAPDTVAVDTPETPERSGPRDPAGAVRHAAAPATKRVGSASRPAFGNRGTAASAKPRRPLR
jgi:hypothetical protein